VKAAFAGLLAGLLVAIAWLALFPPASAVRPESAAFAPPPQSIRSGAPLPSAGIDGGRSADIPGDPPRAEIHAPPVQAVADARPPAPMAGFIAGPPPRAETVETATQRNRRFLDAVNSRVRSSP